MAATYEGKIVTVLRPAIHGDKDFMENAGDQVLIRLADGTDKIVAVSDVRDDQQPVVNVQKAGAPAPALPPKRKRPAVAPTHKRRR